MNKQNTQCHTNMSDNKENRDISVIVGIFIQNEKEEFLFFRMPKWDNKWSICGGHVQRNETLEDAARRELKEEIGLRSDTLSFMSYFEIIKPSDFQLDKHFVGFNFRMQVTGRPEVKTNEELGEQRWMTADVALKQKDLNSLTRKTLEGLQEGKTCNSCEELRIGWQRALADYQNLKKEVEAKRGEWAQEAIKRGVEVFLPVYENMKKAFGHTPAVDGGAWKAWATGCQHIVRQFSDVFSALGVESIETIGEQFNPVFHEAVGEQESDKPSGEILEELESGFKMGDRVLKVARVIISK